LVINTIEFYIYYNESNQLKEFDFDVDFEKKSSYKKTKYALKETLKVLNDFVESHKKEGPCQNKMENKGDKCCDKKSKHPEMQDCCCENDCAKCIVGSREACDAPEIDKLLNTVYTTIPHFFTETGALIPLIGTTATAPYTFPDFNYYVALPCDSCDEIRLLWPLVWMIPQIIQRLRFTGAGFVKIRMVLNVLSKKLIKDPAQLVPTLNTGGVNNGPCICDASSAAEYDYTFLFAFTADRGIGTLSSLTTRSTVTFSAPNNATVATFDIDPVTLALSVPVFGIANTSAFLATLVTAILPTLPPLEVVGFLTALGVPAGELTTLVATIGADSVVTVTTNPIPGFITITVNTSPPTIVPVRLPATPLPVISSIPVSSPAHYVSYVPSCEKEGCEGYWVATNLETVSV